MSDQVGVRRVRVSGARLLADLERLSRFGARADGGVDRVAGSRADLESRGWLMHRARSARLRAHSDPDGNVFLRSWGGTQRVLLCGSHTDTVPAGGRFDGAVGVMAGLEVLRSLHENQHPAADSLEVVSFWDEEGAAPESRGGLTGSRAFCDSARVGDVDAYVELHVEQGPRMTTGGAGLAVVEGVVGVDRHRVRLFGETNHAGTTPMASRADAGRAAAKVCALVKELALFVDPEMVSNVGCISFHPNAPNVVPGEAELTVELRSVQQQSLDTALANLIREVEHIATSEQCSYEVQTLSRQSPVAFDTVVKDVIAEVCEQAAPPAPRLWSYAGHDASPLAQHVRAGMIFVPSVDGVSHHRDEYTRPEHVVLGCQALCDVIVELHARLPVGRPPTVTTLPSRTATGPEER